MLVFLDTEFSDLLLPELISIGLIDEDGRSLYLELDNIGPSVCSKFVQESVWPLLGGPKVSPPHASDLLAEYFAPYTGNLALWTDAPSFDIKMLNVVAPEDLRFRVAPFEFETEKQRQLYLKESERGFLEGLRRHHALDDAKAARLGWLAAQRAKVPPMYEALSPAFAGKFKSPPC